MKQKKFYNHALDVAFTVISEEEDWQKLTEKEMLAGLAKRLASLMAGEPGTIDECFGYSDTYELTEEEAKRDKALFWEGC